MKKTVFATFLAISTLNALAAQSALAADPRTCRARIYEALGGFRQTWVRELEAGGPVKYAPQSRFAMHPLNHCGVELIEDKGYVRVEEFETPDFSKAGQIKFVVDGKKGDYWLGVHKFETIKLNENDPTFAAGRVKGGVSCEITEDGTLRYETRAAVYADGVKSPVGVTTLELKETLQSTLVTITAGVGGGWWSFKSVTTCELPSASLVQGPQWQQSTTQELDLRRPLLSGE